MTDTDVLEELPPSPGELMHRAAGEISDVRFPDRLIEVVAHPYNSEAVVMWKGGRMVGETCERGAYAGIERRTDRIKVNRDHDLLRTVGRAHLLDADNERGLITTLRISRTPLGDETLELAADGALDASVAYKPLPGGEHWSRDRSRVRLTRCWLGHIALVPEPAYEDANVLSVRQQEDGMTALVTRVVAAMSGPPEPVPTPRIDETLAWLRSGQYRTERPSQE